jgi:hypothetical protein
MPAKGAPRRSTPGTLNHLFFEVLEKHACVIGCGESPSD